MMRRLFTTAGKAGEHAHRFLSRGVVEWVRNPRIARAYWRHMAGASTTFENIVRSNGQFELPRSGSLPIARLDEIVPGATNLPLSLADYRYGFGDMPLHDLVVLCRLVKALRPRTIFEMGTYRGATTVQLAVNSDAAIHTLDLPPPGHDDYREPTLCDPGTDVYPEHPGEQFRETPYASKITQIFSDSRSFDARPYAHQMELVLVDACHHYEYVVNDTAKAFQMVSPNGIVIWHDYAPYAPDVQQALHEIGRTRRLVQLSGTTLVVFRNESPQGGTP